MKRFPLWQLGAAAGMLALMAPVASLADEYDKKTIVTISQPTEAPGIVLQPGTYVIRLLNSASNRHIAEIMNERMNHLYALTFTAAAERVTPAGKTVLTFYEGTNGRPPALKTWFWPGDTIGQEFLYPKKQAAKIAADTHQRVPEGNLPTVAESGQSLVPDNANGLSEENSVISEKKESANPLAAKAEEPPANPQPPAVIAQNTPPANPNPAPEPSAAPRPTSDNDTSVSANNAPQDKTLPQTASPLPLIALLGFISIAAGASIGVVRRRSSIRG